MTPRRQAEGTRRRSSAPGRLMRRAAEWRLLSLLLERPRAGWREEVRALQSEVRSVRLRAAAQAALQATEGEYLGMVGPGGAVSVREVAYCGHEDPGHVLAELAAFYEAFAFRPRAEDPTDHVAVEVGFVGYLLLKEAFARAAGDRSGAEASADARQQFIGRHLARLAGALAQRLAAAGASYLLAPARLLAARVPNVAPAPGLGDPGTALTCGGCAV